MVFVHPTWFEGLLFYAMIILIPTLIGFGIFVYGWLKHNNTCFVVGFIIVVCSLVILVPLSFVAWHYTYEVPSVDVKNVTVASWQAKPNIITNKNGMMVIDNANQLMMVTTDGESYLNEENFLFGKFDTRDILNKAKPNSTLQITYYGWREGFNSGFPNILSVDVIDDSNASNVNLGDYFGTKVIS